MNRFLLATTLTALSFGAVHSVMAQGMNPASLETPGLGKASKSATGGPTEKAPPALPGARAEQTPVAPAAKSALDLPPNEALFDAINRGDLVTAKDAVSRGADLNAQNVLGLTPIELAVDLGRNQLSFYLLSLRGSSTGATTHGGPPGTTQAAAPAKQTRAERLAAERAERVGQQRQHTTVADATPVAPQTARLFSGDGGQPNPQAGFLGFNAVR